MVQDILTRKYIVLRLLPYSKVLSALKLHECGGSFIKILTLGETFHPLSLFLFPPSSAEPLLHTFHFPLSPLQKEDEYLFMIFEKM